MIKLSLRERANDCKLTAVAALEEADYSNPKVSGVIYMTGVTHHKNCPSVSFRQLYAKAKSLLYGGREIQK